MTGNPVAPHIVTNAIPPNADEENVNPFENPHTYSSESSTTSLPSRPPQAVVAPTSPRRYMAKDRRVDSVAGRDLEVPGVEQEQVFDEKRWSHKSQQASIERTSRHIQDLEKGYSSPRTSQPRFYTNEVLSIQRSSNSLHELDSLQAQKAWRILLHLSGPCVLLSFATFGWAFLSLLIILLSQPLRLCSPRLQVRQQICHFLAPTLNLHLRCIYAPVFPRPTEDDEIYRAGSLLLVHLIAPFASICSMVAAWVVAMYWGLARIVGDPSGVDKKDDGAEAVMGLTRFWQALLMKGINL